MNYLVVSLLAYWYKLEKKIIMLQLLQIFIALFAIIHHTNATFGNIDSPEVDFRNFPFFRYLTRDGRPASPQQLSLLQNGLERAGAVVKYVRNTFLGSPWLRTQHTVPFDPSAGQRNSAEYQQKYGFRGERLIELIGKGIPPEALKFISVDPRQIFRSLYNVPKQSS